MTKEECAKNAEECSHMAGIAKGTEEKLSWLRLADSWLRLACASQSARRGSDVIFDSVAHQQAAVGRLGAASSSH